MNCKRLLGLVKNWYIDVQEESMAPARMVSFMEQHISQCEVCIEDPGIQAEFEKIKEIVLPPSKVPKKQKAAETEQSPEQPEQPLDHDAAVEENVEIDEEDVPVTNVDVDEEEI